MTFSFGAALAPQASAPDRVDDVLGAACELGLGHLRFTVPWAVMEPRPGAVNGTVVEDLRAAAEASRAAGIAPWFLLLQPEVPHWFDDEGGWLDARFAARTFARWVETVAVELGDVAAGWVPFEAPSAIARRAAPDDAPRADEVRETLVVAWRDAWRVLRGGGAPVATSLDGPALDVWARGLADGLVAVPGRAERELPDLRGAADIVGVAVSGDVETVLHRVAEMIALRPLAVTFRAAGPSESERRGSIEGLRRDLDRTAEELDVRWASVVTADLPADLPILRP